jgi:calcineurin-like phosphoesterase family protein/PA14 domain-containing protein
MKSKNPLQNLILVFLSIFSFIVNAQENSLFKTDVDQPRKPWTNTDFYNDPSNFQFALVSDNTGGSREGVFDLAMDKLNLMMPEFVLSIGDLIEGYTENREQINKEWEEFNLMVEKLKMPFFYLPGNHDITNTVMQEEWEKRYGRRYYNFTYKDVLFIILDSNDDDDQSITEAQTNYALKAIEENKNVKWTFVLVHHPIWKYDTGGRFEKIEEALSIRKHTVLAGHEHHYQHIERKKTNYYVLGTTGGGSRLRGNKFGEFDHIVWMTMTENGPIMANLRLDGILTHDISNEATHGMAKALLENTAFENLVLTNSGEKFINGTVYFRFQNTSTVPLELNLSFLHHHQVDIIPAKEKIKLTPGEVRIVEITLESKEPLAYEELGFLQYYWKLGYEGEANTDFYLDGNADFSILPSSPDYFKPSIPKFIKNTKVIVDQPFPVLMSNLSVNGTYVDAESLLDAIPIAETSNLELVLTNAKGQSTTAATKSYEKVSLLKGIRVKNTVPGLKYTYHEGVWSGASFFANQPALKKGSANDFLVSDIADNEDNFGIRYKGYIQIPESGLYYFRCRADDVGTLKIHDTIICADGTQENLDNDIPGVGPIGAVALKKGMHPVEIDFYENQGGERLRFYYKKSEEAKWIFMELDDFFRTQK